jgi:cytochrome c biogenesis protein CcdA
MQSASVVVERTGWSRARGLGPYIVLAALFVLIAYYGTALYNFFIPTVVQQRDFSLGLYTLAVIGGAAAFLSPCAFGMLPAYFSYVVSLDSTTGTQEGNLARGFRYGLAAAAGMITVAVVLALLVLALGATFAPSLRVVTAEPNAVTRALRIGVGLILIVLGVQQWRGRPIALGLSGLIGRAQARAGGASRGTHRPLLAFYLYGVLYVVAAMPCVTNVMAAPLLAAAATQGLGGVVVTESLFLGSMAALMIATSALVGASNQRLLRALGAAVPTVLRVASVVLIAMGATIVYLDLDLATFREQFFHFPIR